MIAAVSSEEKAQAARDAGADEAIVYPPGPFDRDGQKALAQQFKDAVGPAGADVIFDPVGGDYAEAALRAIAWEGRFLVVGFPAGIPKLPLNLTLLKSCDVCGVFWGAFAARDPQAQRRACRATVPLVGRGQDRAEGQRDLPARARRRGDRRAARPQGDRQAGGDAGLIRLRPLSRAANRHGDRMTTFDDRERAFETKFAHDEEMKFRITARRNRLLGEWAARQMGLTDAESRILRQGRGPLRLRGSRRP